MIDLLLDDDQEALRSVTADFLAKEVRGGDAGPVAGHDEATGFDRTLWERCADLGWYSLSLPEPLGGMGLSVVEEVLLCREIGRKLLPLPYLSTIAATKVAALSGSSELCHDLAAGKLVVGLAERRADGRTLAMCSTPVDLTLVVDHVDGTVRLVEGLRLDEDSVEDTIDPSLRLATVIEPAKATTLVDAGVHADDVLVHGAVLSAAMLAGIAEQTRDDSVAYAKDRVQYGRPIGTFQAVKHRCADMALRAERAWAQTAVAALRIRSHGSAARFEGYAAKVVASDAGIFNGRNNIQNHGGIGFTSEHDAHRYLKRAHVLDFAFGTGRQHLDRLIDLPTKW